MTAITLTTQKGNFAAYEGSLANCIQAINENCQSADDIIAVMYRSADAYTIIIKQTRISTG